MPKGKKKQKTDCPTPHKTAYPTKKASISGALFLAGKVGTARSYRCSCGKWHLSSKTKRQGLHDS